MYLYKISRKISCKIHMADQTKAIHGYYSAMLGIGQLIAIAFYLILSALLCTFLFAWPGAIFDCSCRGMSSWLFLLYSILPILFMNYYFYLHNHLCKIFTCGKSIFDPSLFIISTFRSKCYARDRRGRFCPDIVIVV